MISQEILIFNTAKFRYQILQILKYQYGMLIPCSRALVIAISPSRPQLIPASPTRTAYLRVKILLASKVNCSKAKLCQFGPFNVI